MAISIAISPMLASLRSGPKIKIKQAASKQVSLPLNLRFPHTTIVDLTFSQSPG